MPMNSLKGMTGMNERFLASVYGTPHLSAASIQGESDCMELARTVSAFCTKERLRYADGHPMKDALLSGVVCPERDISWLPSYGCAWVAHPSQGCLAGKITVHVIGLDVHRFRLHCSTPNDSYVHTGDANDYASLYVGAINSNEVETLKKEV